MKMDFEHLIISYLKGEVSQSDKEVLLSWITADQKNEDLFISLYEAWILSGLENGIKIYNAQEKWSELNELIHYKNGVKSTNKNRSGVIILLKRAASWLLVFMLGLASMYIFNNKEINMPSNPIIVKVPLGAKGNILLPDGTRVWLNAGTEITYNQDYGMETRSLNLTGEAYFDVAKDPEHPFIVNAAGLKIRALGTKFNVKAYPEEKSVLTTLEEGKIDVQVTEAKGKTQNVILLPDQNIVYQKTDQKLTTKVNEDQSVNEENDTLLKNSTDEVKTDRVEVINDVNTKLYTSWKEDEWIIEREPLGELAAKLERRYNVKILFKDEVLKDYNFTGTIRNESIEQIMAALKLTAPLEFTIEKNEVILSSNLSMKDQFRHITKP